MQMGEIALQMRLRWAGSTWADSTWDDGGRRLLERERERRGETGGICSPDDDALKLPFAGYAVMGRLPSD